MVITESLFSSMTYCQFLLRHINLHCYELMTKSINLTPPLARMSKGPSFLQLVTEKIFEFFQFIYAYWFCEDVCHVLFACNVLYVYGA